MKVDTLSWRDETSERRSMGSSDLSSTIGRRFHTGPVPTAVACLQSEYPITFAHVAREGVMPGPSLAAPVEDSITVHVHHAPLSRLDLWVESRHRPIGVVPGGSVFVYDMRTEPISQSYESFEFSRFHISRAAMDELAFERGIHRLGNLRLVTCVPDPIVRQLALLMLQRAADFGPEKDSLFNDGIALAFFAHIARKYAGIAEAPVLDGVFAPWQLRRLKECVTANLDGPVSIAEMAGLVSLSRTHFVRTFRRSFWMSPHQWLLSRRIARAKELLKGTLPLAAVAAMCGFVDQSHFTKVFTRLASTTPGAWRRQRS